MRTLTRRAGVGTLVAVTATAAMATPTFAQTGTGTTQTRAQQRAAAVTQSNTHRTFRRWQQAIEVLQPYIGDNDPAVFIAVAQALKQRSAPRFHLEAIEWLNRALAVAPRNTTAIGERAGAYGDAGFRYNEERLTDRARRVQIEEEASATKTAAAGSYSDLAGAHNAFIRPSGGGEGASDRNRAEETLKWRSKAIEVGETFGRLLDRAELINTHFNNPTMGRTDVQRAWDLVERMDQSLPATWFAKAQAARRIASLPQAMTFAGVNVTIAGHSYQIRESVGQLRNIARDLYTKYIEAFEASGRDYSRFGDAVGAYENRAAVQRNMGGNFHRDAIKDQETLIQINPTNPGYWRNVAVSLDAIGERTAANRYYQEYLNLQGNEDTGDVGATRARLANG